MHGTNPIRKLEKDSTGEYLQIREIFLTMQGEGPYAGRRAVFVRLSGCHLACSYCFGWRDRNGRQPFLSMVKGPRKQLGQAQLGDWIYTFDDSGELVETQITNIIRKEVNQWCEIVINEVTYFVTPEHPFFTNRGMISAENIIIGDEILHVDFKQILTAKKLGDKNPMKLQENINKMVANKDWKAIGNKIAETIAQKKEAGTYRHSFQALTPEQLAATGKKISEGKKGELNPNWNGGGPTPIYTQEKEKLKGVKLPCERCKVIAKLEIHHKDHDKTNDTLENFEKLCHPCHSKEHRRGYNFWQGERADGKKFAGNELPKNGLLVSRVKFVDRTDPSYRYDYFRPKPLPVTSITCAPYPTYLADNFWNHNCDTTWDDANDPNMHYADIVSKIMELWLQGAYRSVSNPLVILTGGEPTRQNIIKLIHELLHKNCIIQIETAGSFWWEAMAYSEVKIVVSPKTPHVHPNVAKHAVAYKYVIRASDQLSELGLPIGSTQENSLHKSVRLAEPPPHLATSSIYVSPCDEGNTELNKANLDVCLRLVLERGYTLNLQQHKIVNLP